jgi:[acyl-carrier-protein] S-malonyltransferase
VQWEATMRSFLAHGVEKFYELGPQRVLAGLLKRVDRKMECVNIQA